MRKRPRVPGIRLGRQAPTSTRTGGTYWNGEPCEARRVRVRVRPWRDGDPPQAWWKPLVGQFRDAVEVVYAGRTFYLDDESDPGADPENSGRRRGGWAKVTDGRGSPRWGHRELPRPESGILPR